MKYNLSRIMSRAWQLFRRYSISFSEALHRAWISAKAVSVNQDRIAKAKELAGVTEEVRTYSAWRENGYKVIHGEKSLFSVALIWESRGDGAEYRANFFGLSQVEAMA